MQLKKSALGGLAAVMLLATTSISTAEVTAHNANDLLQAVQDAGFVATMGTDSDGDPRISSRVSDTKFLIYFYGCENNKDCKSILIKAGYDLDTGITASKVNEWNRNKRFGKAYIDDDGDPYLEMDVNMDFDGLGDKNFADTLDWWRVTVEKFEEFIGW